MFVFLNGLILGLSLIMALGPQNIFLAKQGARRNHATLSAAVLFFLRYDFSLRQHCGLHELLLSHPTLQIWLMWLGSAFYYITRLKPYAVVYLRKLNEMKQPTTIIIDYK